MKKPQLTNQTKTSALSVRRILIALMVCFALFALFMTQREAIREHHLYFTQDRKDVAFQLSDLSEAWTEKALRQKFAGIPLNCYPSLGEGLGDRMCVLDTKSYNGVPALFISFFFTADRLLQAIINVPWWDHQLAYNYLVTSIGQQTASQLLPHSGVRLHGWSMPSGAAVFYNRDKSLNPLQWNGIYWRSAASCANGGCFMP